MTALERLLECVNALLCLMGLGEKGFKVLGEECFLTIKPLNHLTLNPFNPQTNGLTH